MNSEQINTQYNPMISNKNIKDDTLFFTLTDVDVSIANAIRRVILSDINLVVFRTTPNEASLAKMIANTTRLNNEILKQRLSCIPVHIKDLSMEELGNLTVEVNEENTTDTIMVVTTKHFKIKDKTTNKYLPDSVVQKIFPPFIGDNGVSYFIEFVRLRPKISDEILGEKIHFTCDFSIGSAKENCMFNTVGTCAYGFTMDESTVEEELAKKQEKWKNDKMDEATIDYESRNWRLLEAKRFTVKNSFDFQLKTCCVFENDELIYISCQELINKFNLLIQDINQNKMTVNEDTTSTINTNDYILANEDYTLGNALNHLLYKNYYEGSNKLSYCGFKKMHPHDTDSIIRMTFKEDVSSETGFQFLKECCIEAIEIFRKIMVFFTPEDEEVVHYNNTVLTPVVETQYVEPSENKNTVQKESIEELDEDEYEENINNSPQYPNSPDYGLSPQYPNSPDYGPSPPYPNNSPVLDK
jgi:DNA-directed RNA polymerase subunit L